MAALFRVAVCAVSRPIDTFIWGNLNYDLHWTMLDGGHSPTIRLG